MLKKKQRELKDELAHPPSQRYSFSDSDSDDDHPPALSNIFYDSSDDERCTLEGPPASVPVVCEPTPAAAATPAAAPTPAASKQFKLYEVGDPLIGKIFPHFVIYLMDDGANASRAEIEAIKTGGGLERVKRVYVIEPAQYQAYHCSTLGPHPHCQMNKLEVSSARTSANDENKARLKQSGRKPVEFVTVAAGKAYRDDFLEVSYSNKKLAEQILRDNFLVNRLLSVPKQVGRNNKQINWGTKGWYSTSRIGSSKYGLPKPDDFKGPTKDPLIQEAVKGFSAIYGAALERSKTAYLDPHRSREFSVLHMQPPLLAGQARPILPEASSYSLDRRIESMTLIFGEHGHGNQSLVQNNLRCHRDKNNDFRSSYSDVMGAGLLLYEVEGGKRKKKGLSGRVAAVSYGVLSAGGYMDLQHRYNPILRKCHKTYCRLKPYENKIDLERLLPHTPREIRNGKFFPEIHLKKTFLYGTLADPIERFFSTFPHLKNHKYLFGLIYCSTVSNCIQHFYQELLHVVKNNPRVGKKRVTSYLDTDEDAIQFVWEFYQHMFRVCHPAIKPSSCQCQFKSNNGTKKHPNCKCKVEWEDNRAWDYPLSDRYIPTHNTKCKYFHIVNTVKAIGLCFECLWKVPKNSLHYDPFFYFSRAIHRLGQKCNGSEEVTEPEQLFRCGGHHLGDFLSHHVLGVGIYCGIVPRELHNCAQVSAGTKTHKRLEGHPYCFKRDGSNSAELLKCLCASLRLNYHEAEELVCKTLREGVKVRKQWRIGDKVGDITNGKTVRRAIWRHRDGSPPTEPKALLEVDKLRNLETPFNHAVYWTAESPELRPRVHRTRKVLQPSLKDEFPVLEDGEAMKIQVVHYNKVVKRGPQPNTAVLEPMYARLILRKPLIVGFLGTVTVTSLGVVTDTYAVDEAPAHLAPGKYFACQVELPCVGDEKRGPVVEPPPDFPLRENYPLRGDTFVVDGVIYFPTQSDAEDYALLWSLVTYPGRYSQDKIGRLFLCPPIADEGRHMPLGGYQNEEEGPVLAVKSGGRGGHRYTFDVWGRTSNLVARVVRLRNSLDGMVLYLTDEMGCCISGVVTIPASPCLPRKIEGWDESGEVAGIIAHRYKEVLVGWLDGASSWVTIAAMVKDAPHQMRQYGRLAGLHKGVPGWVTITGSRHKSDFDSYHPTIEVYYDPDDLEREKQQRRRSEGSGRKRKRSRVK